jgi:dTDP-4-amino-4,6-dideoxygalactose transaminase
MAGSFGSLATFSFYPSKNLGAMGDGGMMTTREANLAVRLRILRSHGEAEKYLHQEFCLNSRLDALQAAILRVKLRHLEQWTQKRREAANRYDDLLEQTGLSPEKFTLPYRLEVSLPHTRHTFYQYTIRCRDRDALSDYLMKRGIGSGVHYPHVVYRQPAFEVYREKETNCTEAEKACVEVLSIPMFPELTAEQQEYVVNAISEFYS